MNPESAPQTTTAPIPPDEVTASTSPELFASIYQTIGARRLGYDTMMWQVPALSFTAQAFLLTLALSGTAAVARITAAALALVIAIISMQLMAKHRFNEELDSRLLEAFEKRLEIADVFGCPPHAPPGQRMRTVNAASGLYAGVSPIKKPWYVGMSSYGLWQRGLALFALTSAGIVTVNVIYVTGWAGFLTHAAQSLPRLLP